MSDADARGAAAARPRLENLIKLYAMLSRINRSIVRIDNPHELYLTACRIAVEDGGFAVSWIGMVEPGSGRVVAVARAGAPLDLERFGEAVADGRGPAAVAIREGRPRVVNDVAGEAGLAPLQAVLDEVAVHALAAFPLTQEGRTVGAFVVAAEDVGAFDTGRVILLSEVAGDVSFALEVMRHEERRAVAESKIHYLAFYDPQTGLPGRELWTERLAAACGERAEVAVLVARLRNYHGVLQVLGQAQGPAVARMIAGRLEQLLPTSPIGRITESELAVVVERADGLHTVEETAWAVGAALAEAVAVDGREVFLDPFVGIALYPKDGTCAEETLKAALVAAAGGGQDARERCRFYKSELDQRSQWRFELEAALRRALERGEFRLQYQPQVDLESGRIVGAEALLRWERPGHGLVSPVEFVPLLEDTGLIVPVGAWVLEEACRCARRWQEQGLPAVRMAVNLSARQFEDDDVGALVRRVLGATGLEARWLELEITESTVLLNADAVIRSLAELQALGVSHSLDDFGTGYSSLSYLQRLPVARIKIDRSFITQITSAPQDAAIVRAVVGMAHSLGIRVIAEGVESEGQLGYLCGLGCEEMQGYLFSRPLPPDDFAALLREDRRLDPIRRKAGAERVLLLVDDDVNVLASLRRLLRRTEFEVLSTSDVDEAFSLLATCPVGVIVCDQRMPAMTGTEFLRRVRDLHPQTVRIVLSGYTDLKSVIDAVNRGAIYKFLTKPWDDDILLDSLRDAFRLFEMERENRELSRRVQGLTGKGARTPE